MANEYVIHTTKPKFLEHIFQVYNRKYKKGLSNLLALS